MDQWVSGDRRSPCLLVGLAALSALGACGVPSPRLGPLAPHPGVRPQLALPHDATACRAAGPQQASARVEATQPQASCAQLTR